LNLAGHKRIELFRKIQFVSGPDKKKKLTRGENELRIELEAYLAMEFPKCCSTTKRASTEVTRKR